MTTPLELSQFEQIFKNNHKRLCNLAYKIVGEKDASEDIVQELFVKIWNKRENLMINEVKSYLNRSTINASLNYLKSGKSRKLMASMDGVDIGSNSTEEYLNASELQTKIELAIRKLPSKCQAIFALSRFENMSSKEIAQHLNVSTKTVDNQIGIALSKLRKELKPYLIISGVTLLILGLLYFMFMYG